MSTPNDDIAALFASAAGEDEDQAWAAIHQLRSINTDAVFEHACRLCLSADDNERCAGVDVIAQIGIPERTYHERTVQVLLAMLQTKTAPEVLESIAIGLGHRHEPRAIEPLLRFQQHTDTRVRYGVVFGLLGHEDPRAVAALIGLSADADGQVRDWATFGLGTQVDTDTPALREALVARLYDSEGNTAGEAMVGLARRKDARVIMPLLELLQSRDAGTLLFEAAAELADPVFLPVLEQIHAQWQGPQDWQYHSLEDAIAACTPSEAA